MFLVHVTCWAGLYHEKELDRVLLIFKVGRRGGELPPSAGKEIVRYLSMTTENPGINRSVRMHSVKELRDLRTEIMCSHWFS